MLPLVSLMDGDPQVCFLGAFILIATWRAQWLKLFRWHPAFSGAITSNPLIHAFWGHRSTGHVGDAQ